MSEDSTSVTTRPVTARGLAREAGPVGLLALAWTFLPALLGFLLLLKLGSISSWLASLGAAGVVLYVVIFSVSAGLGLLPTYAQAILGGWVFGLALGLPAALIGLTTASAIGYLCARMVSGPRIERLLARHPKAEIVKKSLVDTGPWRTFAIVTLIRIPPNSPFALTNLVIAACGVRLVTCLAGTAVGMLPRTAVAVAFAAAARSTGAEDIQSFVRDGLGIWVMIGGVLAMIIVIAIIGAIAKRALAQLTKDGTVRS